MNRPSKTGGTLFKPAIRRAISRLRGILKRKPGGKPLAEEWADHKATERELENRRTAIRYAGTAE